jgi:hypothetical protein
MIYNAKISEPLELVWDGDSTYRLPEVIPNQTALTPVDVPLRAQQPQREFEHEATTVRFDFGVTLLKLGAGGISLLIAPKITLFGILIWLISKLTPAESNHVERVGVEPVVPKSNGRTESKVTEKWIINYQYEKEVHYD